MDRRGSEWFDRSVVANRGPARGAAAEWSTAPGRAAPFGELAGMLTENRREAGLDVLWRLLAVDKPEVEVFKRLKANRPNSGTRSAERRTSRRRRSWPSFRSLMFADTGRSRLRAQSQSLRLHPRRPELEPFFRRVHESFHLRVQDDEVEVVADGQERRVFLHEDAVDLPIDRHPLALVELAARGVEERVHPGVRVPADVHALVRLPRGAGDDVDPEVGRHAP